MMEWKVPLFEPDLGEEALEAVGKVIRSKWLTMGEMTSKLERRFAEFVGCRHAIAVSNGTAALHLALTAVDIGPDDDVVCPSLTFVATANAIRYCKAQPIFADVASLNEWNISADTIEAVLTSRTKAVIVVHYAGYPCNMEQIRRLCIDRNLALVEDVAHAPGAKLEGRAMGTWGDVGCFSFFSNKNMTTGEGGMITTESDDMAERLRLLRSHGMTTLTLDRHKGHAFSYDVLEFGFNYRMGELNAALGLAQLKQITKWNNARREIVQLYRSRLAATPEISIPFEAVDSEPAYHIMPVLLPKGVDRSRVMRLMREHGVQTSIHYRPVDTFTAYIQAGLGPDMRLKYTNVIGQRVLTLPLYPSLPEDSVNFVCQCLTEAIDKVLSE